MMSKQGIGLKCPACEGRLKISITKCFERSFETRCPDCSSTIVSELGWIAYIAFGIYCQFIIAIVAVPLIVGFLDGRFLMALSALAIGALATIPPAIVLHGRHLQVLGTPI